RQAVRAVLHDEGERPRPRTLDQPRNRDRTWRHDLGGKQSHARGDGARLDPASRKGGKRMSPDKRPSVYLADDDVPILNGFARLPGASGYKVQAFSSPSDFLAKHDPDLPGCALFDVGMDELDGLSLHERLIDAGVIRPVIFVTGQDNARTGVRAMK